MGLMREAEMDEVDEERDGVLVGVRDSEGGMGRGVAGTKLYLVHACRCCLVTKRKQIEARELESKSPFIFYSLFLSPLLALPSSKIRTQARTHQNTFLVSSSLTRRKKRGKKCSPSLTVRIAAVLMSGIR